MADGSGVQMVHLTKNTTRPTNSSSLTGTNKLTTPPTSYDNTIAKNYKNNLCLETKLLLAGSTATLTSAESAWSDGYTATLSIALEFFNAGAAGGWRGACIVLYSA